MRKYTKLGIVILGVLLCNSIFTNGQPPTGPLVVSPEIHSDKKVTFRYLAPLAKEVKLSAQFEKSQVVMTKDAVGIHTS